MRLLLLGLLLVGSCCLSRAGLILENGAPIMWAHATSQPTDLTITEGVLTPDPWHYLHRMSFYRILIAATDPYMTSMGPGDNQSPIWGLPLQLGWMLTSGRLADPTGLTVCGTQGGDTADMCISTNSWWGCVNYFSSALPFLSAPKQGILGDGVSVQMQSPAGVEGYCTTYDSCKTAHPDVINNWDSFFQGLKDATTSPLPENEKKDAILGLYWRAQMSSTCRPLHLPGQAELLLWCGEVVCSQLAKRCRIRRCSSFPVEFGVGVSVHVSSARANSEGRRQPSKHPRPERRGEPLPLHLLLDAERRQLSGGHSGEHVAQGHVLSDDSRKRTRDAQTAALQPRIRHLQLPLHRHLHVHELWLLRPGLDRV
ncbi:hypothetical protein NQD34_018129 [Periophthalmus magnuspinnatus]|nr:hypothetical protein NQD34_018129 [Periophthalmus magnuspinnatus]